MIAFEILVILLLILLNGVFAMSELAVVSSRKVRLRQMAESGSAGAKTALRLIDDPGRFLSTIQIGITLVGIVAGAYGGARVAGPIGDHLEAIPALAGRGNAIAVTVVVAVITYLSLIVGELVPKRIALRNPERVAALIARPMRLLSRLAAPLVWFLRTSTDLVLRLLGLHGEREATVTEEEIKSLITEGTRAGVFVPEEKSMIEGVLRLADRPVRAIMTPRPDIDWLDLEDPPERIIEDIRESRHSWFLICRGELDDVVGGVHARDLLPRALRGEPFDLMAASEDALVVHDGTPVLRLLDLMRRSGRHMAVVVDEYGGVEGIVTLTDVLEAIAGDLPEAGEEPESSAIRREDGSWLVSGAMPIDEAEEVLGIRGMREAEGGYHTVAGFVLNQLRHLPTVGEQFVFDGARFEVLDMDERRIDKVLVVPAPEPPEADAT